MHIQTDMNTFPQKLGGLSEKHRHTHTHKDLWPADGAGLMYFDDMKVDHIYMQIEVPD